MRYSISARAKLNLTLDIIGVRDDGYHLLKMVMQSVSLSDTVTVSDEADDGEIRVVCSDDSLPDNEENIVWKAAQAFFEVTGVKNTGVQMKVKKRIPVAAGLGGGSADAAAVVLALDRMFETELSGDAMRELASEIGADVPFCLEGGTMLAEGTGTILTPLPDLPECWFVIVKPAEKPSTAQMYRLYDAAGAQTRPQTQQMVDAICEGDLLIIGHSLSNVFEDLWQDENIPQMKELFFEHGALGASLSGSGPSVFALFDQKSDAERCASVLRRMCEDVYVCQPAAHGCEWN